jgi:hypothetical protein
MSIADKSIKPSIPIQTDFAVFIVFKIYKYRSNNAKEKHHAAVCIYRLSRIVRIEFHLSLLRTRLSPSGGCILFLINLRENKKNKKVSVI